MIMSVNGVQALNQFDKSKYLNLETFRKSGIGVKTPVWFVKDGGILYVKTITNSGKVKRIRNNQKVNAVPCKVDGTPTGIWLPMLCTVVNNEVINNAAEHLLDKKYGWLKKVFFNTRSRKDLNYIVLELKPDN